MRLTLCLASLLLASGCAAEPSPETTRQAIVNGEVTEEFPSVGTLTRNLPGGNSGTYCSGTLVAPQWVLTAGHCLAVINGLDLEPALLTFYLGDQLTLPGSVPTDSYQGHYYADARILHPDFNPFFLFHDIGLLHLSEPVVGVVPYPLRTASLEESFIGAAVTYVGFGKLGMSMGGTGTKRVTTMSTGEIQAHYYVSDYQGSGVCEGDSGGPGLVSSDDGYEMVGVISGLVGGTADICHSDAVASRVDYYASWVTGHLDGPGPNCHEMPDMCLCPAGCTAKGACDNALCALESCFSLGACLTDCAGGLACTMRCRRRADAGLLTTWTVLDNCDPSCEGTPECLAAACAKQYEACAQSAAGDRVCHEILTCLATCQGQACQDDCLGQGNAVEQGLVEALLTCDGDGCSVLQELCDALDRCQDDASCGPDEACHFPLADIAAGLCGCRDDDGDLWCAAQECDDANELVNPGMDELCWDGLDNNCDGDVDEGCAPPVEPGPDSEAFPEAQADIAVAAPESFVERPEVTLSGGGCDAGRAPTPAWFVCLAGIVLMCWRLLGPRRSA